MDRASRRKPGGANPPLCQNRYCQSYRLSGTLAPYRINKFSPPHSQQGLAILCAADDAAALVSKKASSLSPVLNNNIEQPG